MGIGNDLYVAKRIQGSRYLNYWAILSGLPGRGSNGSFRQRYNERKPSYSLTVYMKKLGLVGHKVSSFENFPFIKDIIHKTILSIRRLTDTGSTVEGMKLFNQFL